MRQTFMRRAGCIALGLFLLADAAAAQRQGKPRLDAGRVVLESFGGAYAGIGGFLLGRYFGESVGDLVGVESDVTRRRVGYVSGIVIGTASTAGFVYAVGSVGNTDGDFNATLLGAGVGLVAGYGIDKLLFGVGPPGPGRNTAAQWAAINVLALLPSVGATIGFNSTRRYR